MKTMYVMLTLFCFLMVVSCGNKKSTTEPEANVAPVIKGLTASSAKASYNAKITITADASDGNNDALTFKWSCSGGAFDGVTTSDSGRAAETTAGTISWKAPAVKGTFEITVIVRDKTDSANSSITVQVVGVYATDFSAGYGGWGAERATLSISNGSLSLVTSGTSGSKPYGGAFYTLPSSIPPPYSVKMKIAWATAVSLDQGFGPYIYLADKTNPVVHKLGLFLMPGGTMFNFVAAYSPRYTVPNEFDYDALFANQSSFVPAQANKWVEVTIIVNSNKTVNFKLEKSILYTLDVEAWGTQIGKSIDLSLVKVGCDCGGGSMLVDDVVVDVL